MLQLNQAVDNLIQTLNIKYNNKAKITITRDNEFVIVEVTVAHVAYTLPCSHNTIKVELQSHETKEIYKVSKV